MSDQPSNDSELDSILNVFEGGIHAKGNDKGGYPTYFTEPYPLWVEERKRTAKAALLAWNERQVAQARQDLIAIVFGDIPETWRDSPEGISLTRGDVYALRSAALTQLGKDKPMPTKCTYCDGTGIKNIDGIDKICISCLGKGEGDAW